MSKSGAEFGIQMIFESKFGAKLYVKNLRKIQHIDDF